MEEVKLGQVIEGTVIAIKPFGAILIFSDNRKGLLHISEIANSYIKNIFRYLIIGKTYQVKVINIEEDGFLKVSINKITKEEKVLARTSTSKRSPIAKEYIDFEALKEHLPIWVEEANKND